MNNLDAAAGRFEAIVVGAGFAGLYMLHKLRELGLSAHLIEAGGDVGGTWYWNRYPGARCDNESVEYCYSFSPELQREWRWSERYATQPEILRYLNHVADRFDLRRDIEFDTRVTSAAWDEEEEHWRVQTDRGHAYEARFCIMATGNLSTPKLPDWPGIDQFSGSIYHTGHWPAGDVELAGKRVGVVGTGSSGIQVIPQIAKQADSLVVFQRTPNFAVPAQNRPLTEEEIARVEEKFSSLREAARNSFLGFFHQGSARSALEDDALGRMRRFEESWQTGGPALLLSYNDLLLDERSNFAAAEFVRGKIRSLVHDPDTASTMTPTGYPVGARRLCIEIGYYDTMNQPHVKLVDLCSTPVTKVTGKGVHTTEATFELDALVFATGFYAMVGALDRIEVRGTDGQRLHEAWARGPRTYLGLMVAGFPNLFLVTGPGSPSVLSNVVVSIEQHVEWIAECLAFMNDRVATRIEPTIEAEEAWLRHVDEVAQATLFPKANSWYVGTTRDGRRVFMPYVGGVGAYRRKCREIVDDGYTGFSITSSIARPEKLHA